MKTLLLEHVMRPAVKAETFTKKNSPIEDV